MLYHCPQPADLADVRALNREYLSDLQRQQHRALKDLGREAGDALTRLADAPFLVYELRTPDPGFWDRSFSGTNDLLDTSGAGRDAGQVASTLGFLWHLSRRDAHAARLFTGCSSDWCEKLAATPLVHIINRSLGAGIRPSLRMDADDPRWRAMVVAACGNDKASQLVAVMRVFQALLVTSGEYAPRAAAACRTRSPARRFAVRERGQAD